MKIFMDPAFPTSAYTRHHACGHDEHVGAINYTQEEADTLVLDAHKRGMQVAIHCLGNSFGGAGPQRLRSRPSRPIP